MYPAVGKKLQEATNKIGETEVRSRAIENKLRGVEALEGEAVTDLLPGVERDESELE